jgi:hypothetical protein
MKTMILAAAGAAALMLVAAPALAGYADDRAEIENLQARYMFAMDSDDADAYAGTFAPDGTLDSAGGVEVGRQAIHDFIVKKKQREDTRFAADKSGKWQPRMHHFINNLVLDIHGDTATGRAYWTEVNNMNNDRKAVLDAFGSYEDQMVKIDGHWFFKSRKIYNENLASRHAP